MSQFDPARGLPAQFVDLWSSTATATVTTLSSSGAPQTTATWFLVDEGWSRTRLRTLCLVG